MEKKTIGGLIAALRRANGMTQKDLAERLHVSDKTISRWERGDSEPELSVIPVLAEIFDVSCDELLRGQRRPPQDREELPGPVTSEKGEKERRRLLRTAQHQFLTRRWICLGLSLLGLIAAVLGNLALNESLLGFCLGAAFAAASLICLLIFANGALFSVADSDLPQVELEAFRREVAQGVWTAAAVNAGLLGFLLPLLALGGSHYGVTGATWLVLGLPCIAGLLLVFGVVYYFLNASLVKKGVYSLEPGKETRFWANHRLKKVCVLWLTPVLLITGLLHLASTAMTGPLSAAEAIVFQDYDSFVAYMEQDLPYENYVGSSAPQTEVPVLAEDQVWHDENGNTISEEEAFRSEMINSKGEVVCSYIRRNEPVRVIRYSENPDGSLLPISVITDSAYQRAEQVIARRHVLFLCAYCAETLGAVGLYFLLRKKKDPHRQEDQTS